MALTLEAKDVAALIAFAALAQTAHVVGADLRFALRAGSARFTEFPQYGRGRWDWCGGSGRRWRRWWEAGTLMITNVAELAFRTLIGVAAAAVRAEQALLALTGVGTGSTLRLRRTGWSGRR